MPSELTTVALGWDARDRFGKVLGLLKKSRGDWQLSARLVYDV